MNPYQYINSLNKFGAEGGFKPGLERINLILEKFDHPENKLRVIHVAGSNGKGSTIAFLKGIYTQAGYKVGAYISPPIYRFNERITVNKIPINDRELTDIVSELDIIIKKLIIEEEITEPSFFEFVTAVAFIYFHKKEVDIALMEVGLGGRLDATNIIKSPLISVITNISLEHSAILGETLAEITREKAGIIKQNRPIITGVEEEESLQEIKNIAVQKNADLLEANKIYNYEVVSSSLSGQKVKIKNKKIDRELTIPLLGKHQIKNAILALGVADQLRDLLPIGENDIRRGIKETSWPGRMEIINENPLVIIDGAHNSAGISKLSKFLDDNFARGQKVTIILGILNDKNVREMLAYLNISKFDMEFIITKNENSRSLQPEKIKEIADEMSVKNQIYSKLKDAVSDVTEDSDQDDLILITGSLYTVREAKIILQPDII